MILLLKATLLVACALIMWRAENITNRLGDSVPMTVRLAFWGLLCASAWMIYAVLLANYTPDAQSVMLCVATATWLVGDRRINLRARRGAL